MSTLATLAALANTYPVILLFDIVSVEDGTALHLSQLPITFNSVTYTAAVQSISGLEFDLDSSPLGIMGISDIQMVLGDADGTYTNWDNVHYFKGATVTVTMVMVNPVTGLPASSDSRVIFKGIFNAPDQVTPTALTLSAYNRFNATFLLLPTSRISQFSPTIFPGDGATDCDDANANLPASKASAGYQWQAPSKVAADIAQYLPYFSCAYNPIGFNGSTALGNELLAATTATIHTSTTIGAGTLNLGNMQNQFVVITSGTGAGQARRILSNNATTITVANAFTTTPDGTSVFVILYGFCTKTAEDCTARGMHDTDSSARNCFRFRGITKVPADWRYRSPNGHHQQTVSNQNFAKYNDVIPLVYGTCRVPLKILFNQTANDVRGQYLVCEGPIQNMSALLVEGELIPLNQSYPHVDTSTGMWKFGLGAVGQNYQDLEFPNGDPYSGIAIVSASFPPQFVNNSTSFDISVLVQGLLVPTYNASGAVVSSATFTDNPAWIILDILRRSGWQLAELNVPSFYAFSIYCAQQIAANVSSTCTQLANRFRLSAMILQQQPVADILRAFLGESRGILSYDTSGLLRIDCENRITNTTLSANVSSGTQFATVNDGAGITIGSVLAIGGSNPETVTVTSVQLSGNNFQFQATFANSHSTNDTVKASGIFTFDLSSILNDGNGSPMLTRSSLATANTPNEYTVQFQNSLRQFVQDTALLISTVEANNFGAKVIGQLNAEGFEDVDSAVRAERLALYKGHGRRNSANQIQSRGNLFVTLTSSVKAFAVGVGQIAYLTYAKEGWTSKAFRVTHVAPAAENEFPYWNIQFTLREHDDQWYDDVNGNITPAPGVIPSSPNPKPPLPVPPRPVMPIFN